MSEIKLELRERNEAIAMAYTKGYQQGRADQRKEDEELNYHYQTSHECYQQGRADAIDEFVSKVSESIVWDILAEIMKRNIGASEGADRIIEYLEKIAEQLKEQTE